MFLAAPPPRGAALESEVTGVDKTAMNAHGSRPVLWVVVPCYDEQAVLPVTSEIFLTKLTDLIAAGKIAENSRVLFVDDGSDDCTWEIIEALSLKDEHYLGIRQSRNRGHQNALLAGLMEAKDSCDVTVSIDCDGQDDIDAIDRMLEEYAGGCDVVYGVRSNRDSDTWFKRNAAHFFYKSLNFMSVETVYDHADYRLVSSKVLKHLADFQEVNIFLRGLIPLVGFKSTSVLYERRPRMAGTSHYSLTKTVGLAVDGLTSLSTKPISFIAGMGALVGLAGLVGLLKVLVGGMAEQADPGGALTIYVVLFLGGIQLLSLGIVGTYVGKTYLETKRRPRYIISERTY